MYKIVTKIIVARLRPHLDKLVSPLQTAFVPGRKGIDNAIIVQEVIHTISKKKGRVGYMALKIDLEKAYDKLEWSFIRDMLIRVNLPADLIKVIMSCISTVSTSIYLMVKLWIRCIRLGGLGKVILSRLIFSFFVWIILVNSLRRSVMLSCGSP